MSPGKRPPAQAPRHVAIIMDGNGRWARERHLPRIKGHEQGGEAVRRTVRAALDSGVRVLTLYAFSVENWARPRLEVAALMKLLLHTLKTYERELNELNVRLRVIGRLKDLPAEVGRQLERTVKTTAGNTAMDLVLALSYGARVEIAEAAREIARKAAAGLLKPDKVDEAVFASHLYTAGLPDPDLLIRTSGEMRVSNFLLWQISYTEILFSPVLWPDFDRRHWEAALKEFASRQRRFGQV
jgi:undecaprenyl diphosphate synthase